jgi:hypothetical protein
MAYPYSSSCVLCCRSVSEAQFPCSHIDRVTTIHLKYAHHTLRTYVHSLSADHAAVTKRVAKAFKGNVLLPHDVDMAGRLLEALRSVDGDPSKVKWSMDDFRALKNVVLGAMHT